MLRLNPLAIVPQPDSRARERGLAALAHADALYNLARYLTRNPADAEDLVQETFVRAVRAWDRLAADSDLRAWLFRILRNTHLDGVRRQRRSPVEVGEAGGEEPDAWLRGDFELERMRRLVAEEIEEALLGLAEEHRTVIILDLEGLTEAQVALVVGCPVGTVKSRLSRARAALRAKLADYRR